MPEVLQLCNCRVCAPYFKKEGGEQMLKVGDVVVVKATGVPARFKNIKPGAMFKVRAVRDRAGRRIVVGDHKNPEIKSYSEYFSILTQRDRDQIKSTGNTDLAVRVKAIEDFGPGTAPDAELVRVNINGSFLSLAKEKASALSKKNSGKLIQRKLARALNGR